ncbi:hypothetical protein NX722_23050 [Endozoicomonas gorgoniicola]|uniref:Uncharacterized protein n=1 Tax=Endozoicomonas gorgoniicola TaxID=1234144 RepID=A0ABT3N2M2_9GAMM|nr:hypothetical protein [Endozoicomonas gorgoniicola]MCW7555449.1 hypothetical protein [Endozoicomonas gorgoniicola]
MVNGSAPEDAPPDDDQAIPPDYCILEKNPPCLFGIRNYTFQAPNEALEELSGEISTPESGSGIHNCFCSS